MQFSFRIALVALAGTALIVTGVSLLLAHENFENRISDSLKNESQRKAELIANLFNEPMRLGDYNDTILIASRLLKDEDISSITVINQFGDTIVDRAKSVRSSGFENKVSVSIPMGVVSLGFTYSSLSELTSNLIYRMFAVIVVVVGLTVGAAYLLLLQLKKFVSSLSYGFNALAKGREPRLEVHSILTEISELASQFNKTAQEISNYKKREIENAKEVALTELASRVSHDIRSPLSVLNAIVETSKDELPEKKRLLIQSAAQRINSICETLLQRRKEQAIIDSKTDSDEQTHSVPLNLIVKALICEKRVEYRGKSEAVFGFAYNGPNLYLAVDQFELCRNLSNLINNAVDAIEGPGAINVSIGESKGKAVIYIMDNGAGIPEDVLPRLGEKGFSFGRGDGAKSGTGLGLYHAKSFSEACGGSLRIFSVRGRGTRVEIEFPIAFRETPLQSPAEPPEV